MLIEGNALWDKRDTETRRAHEAFRAYLQLGSRRSLRLLAEGLHKSVVLLGRWSRRHEWVMRAREYDLYESRVINERVALGRASARERSIVLAQQMQARAQARVLSMTQSDVDQMRPLDVVALLRAAHDIETRARRVSEEELPRFAPFELLPAFTLVELHPGREPGQVAVCVDGRWGYVPAERLEEFRRDYPGGVVLV